MYFCWKSIVLPIKSFCRNDSVLHLISLLEQTSSFQKMHEREKHVTWLRKNAIHKIQNVGHSTEQIVHKILCLKLFLKHWRVWQHKLDIPAWCQPAHSEQRLHVDGHSLTSLSESLLPAAWLSPSTFPLGSRVCDPCSLCLHSSIS